MIHYRQHRPAFFEGFTNEEGDLPDLDEVLKLEFVNNFSLSPKFHRFSIGSEVASSPLYSGWMTTLMAEYREGREWWVVAYLWPEDRSELNSLPKWEPIYDTTR
jgi:hypothetical protein